MANTYAANFGDVVKHAVLCAVIEATTRRAISRATGAGSSTTSRPSIQDRAASGTSWNERPASTRFRHRDGRNDTNSQIADDATHRTLTSATGPRPPSTRSTDRLTSRAWPHDAACREPNAPSMFADEWGVGRPGRRRRAAALACCRRCPVRKECGVQALAEVDGGLCLYGVRCGIEFTDVTPSRQQRDIDRLRALVTHLREPSVAGRLAVAVEVTTGRARRVASA